MQLNTRSLRALVVLILTMWASGTIVDAACVPSAAVGMQPQCVTRTARYWFTHVYSSNTNCATLLKAIQANGGTLCVGFVNLPQNYDNGDAVKDAIDATMEAMGFYWRNKNYTGENGGTQGARLRGSHLCRARKELSVELVAAIANNVLLGTEPGNCGTTYSRDIIAEAGQLITSDDYIQMKAVTSLLRQFNKSGVTNQLPFSLQECSDYANSSTLKSISRDTTTHTSCPGANDSCGSATAVLFGSGGDIFTTAVFKDKANLDLNQNSFGKSCGTTVGEYAVWRISPDIAVAGRRFTVTTYDSNFDTVITVRKGANCSNQATVGCNDDDPAYAPASKLSFTTDGANVYYIYIGAGSGSAGSLKMKVTSP